MIADQPWRRGPAWKDGALLVRRAQLWMHARDVQREIDAIDAELRRREKEEPCRGNE